MRSSYTEEEDYEINKYDSLGFINTLDVKISFEDVESDFEMYLIIKFSKVRYCKGNKKICSRFRAY